MKIATLLPGSLRLTLARLRRALHDTRTSLNARPRPVVRIRAAPQPTSPPVTPRPTTASPRLVDPGDPPVVTTLFTAQLVDGRTWTIAPGQTVLAAARNARIRLPCSCTVGGCGACKLQLLEGRVDLPDACCLTDAERAAGQILTCVATPLSNLVIASPSARTRGAS